MTTSWLPNFDILAAVAWRDLALNLVFIGVLMLVFFRFARIMIRKDRDDSTFKLEQLIVGPDGRIDNDNAVMWAGIAVASIVLVFAAVKGVSEGLAIMYGAFLTAVVAPKVSRNWRGKPAVIGPVGQEVTTS